jgi:CRISPR type III-B/RAMP module-associated protein Cmr5
MKQYLSRRQTLEQMRAKEAWRRVVDQIKGESEERQKRSQGKDKGSLEKEYRSRVRSLNAMIQINGLGSTLGFLKAKSNPNEVKEKKDPNASYLLLEHLTEWMKERKFIRTSSDLVEDDSDEADALSLHFLVEPPQAANRSNKVSG